MTYDTARACEPYLEKAARFPTLPKFQTEPAASNAGCVRQTLLTTNLGPITDNTASTCEPYSELIEEDFPRCRNVSANYNQPADG